MNEWKNWIRQLPNAVLHGDEVHIELPDNRRQVVEVHSDEDCLRLQSVAAKRSVVMGIREENPDAELFDRNGSPSPIGIAFGPFGSLLFEACLPLAGLKSQEFQTVLLELAQEADLFEFRYSGTDRF